jgi:hypothetical protein
MRINETERKSVPRVVCLQYLLRICIASALLNALVYMSAGSCTSSFGEDRMGVHELQQPPRGMESEVSGWFC